MKVIAVAALVLPLLQHAQASSFAPMLEKLINEHMPEGLLEDEPEAAEAAEDDD